MILRVGPYFYRVHFVDDYIQHDGQTCLGLCDNQTHDIYVCTRTSFAQQVQIIGHEYMEAWLYHFAAQSMDKEAYCDLFGMAMAQFVLDLTHQLHQFAADEHKPESQHDAIVSAPPAPPTGRRAHEPGNTTTHHDHPRDASPQSEPTHRTREPVARKLADRAARAGLSVRKVYEPADASR